MFCFFQFNRFYFWSHKKTKHKTALKSENKNIFLIEEARFDMHLIVM